MPSQLYQLSITWNSNEYLIWCFHENRTLIIIQNTRYNPLAIQQLKNGKRELNSHGEWVCTDILSKNLALGIFAVRFFAVGFFTVGFLPYGFFALRKFHRTEFLPYGTFAVRIFHRKELWPYGKFAMCIHCTYLFGYRVLQELFKRAGPEWQIERTQCNYLWLVELRIRCGV